MFSSKKDEIHFPDNSRNPKSFKEFGVGCGMNRRGTEQGRTDEKR